MFQKYAFLILTLMFVIFVETSFGQSPLNHGLVGYWSFDVDTVDGTTVQDVSGQHDGVIEGDPQLVPGMFNEAMEFDGSGDQVVMEKIPAVLLDNSDISICFWFYAVDFQPRYMIGTFSSDNGKYYQVFTDDNMFRFSVDDDVIKSQVETELDVNTWYHICAVREKGKQLHLYVDGVLTASVLDETAGSIESDETLRFGNRAAGGRDFNGLLDEVRIYNRVLGPVEILAAMKGEPFTQASGPNPKDGSLHFDTWVTLSWRPGDFAVSHDVYMGDNFDDVNDGAEGTFQLNLTDTFTIVGFPGYADRQ